MPWIEEAAAIGTWDEASPGAFQRNAFQVDAFQVTPSHGWAEPSGQDSTWTEEAGA
jgi:hypothetical protein